MGDYEALEALADLADKGLERQIGDMETLRQKTEASITLGTAALGAGFAVVGVAIDKIPASLTWTLVPLVAIAGALNLVALALLLQSTLAVRRDMAVGPSAEWLSKKADDASWTKQDLWASKLGTWPEIERDNAAALGKAVWYRVAGLRVLMAAMAFYAIAFTYVLAMGVLHPPTPDP